MKRSNQKGKCEYSTDYYVQLLSVLCFSVVIPQKHFFQKAAVISVLTTYLNTNNREHEVDVTPC